MNLWGKLLHCFGWRVDISAPRRDKCVICVAPHTSNWDFILGLFAYKSLGREANFLMKEFWFFFPLKYLLYSFGGIPVARKNKKGSLTAQVIDMSKAREYVNLAVTPEGTRSRAENWHTGFLHIAQGAGDPLQLGVINHRDKLIMIRDEFTPSGNIEADLAEIRSYYLQFGKIAKYPDKFC